MAEYTAELSWTRGPHEPFLDQRYSRLHRIRFDGGATLAGSSSPHSVPLPMSDASAVDPEETFVASIASCHMLWFLSIAAKHGFVVERYDDAAVGVMARNEQGRLSMTRVTLRPTVSFSGAQRPDAQVFAELHHQAHEACYIANSVKSEMLCEPRLHRADPA